MSGKINWQYKSIKVQLTGFDGGYLNIKSFDEVLNSMGNEGWELVNCFNTTQETGKSREAVAVFKKCCEEKEVGVNG